MKPPSTFLRAAGAALLHAAGTFAFRLLMAFLGGLLLVAVARPCGYVRTYAPTYHAPVYETPVLAAVYTPTVLAVAVPQVTVGYAPAPVVPVTGPSPTVPTPAPAVHSDCAEKLARLEQEFAELKAALKPAPPPAGTGDSLPPGPAPGMGGAPVHSVMLSCVACHGRTAEVDAKSYRFFDDSGRLLATAPLGRMTKRAYRGDMPPPKNKKGIPPLTDEQLAQFIDEIGNGPPAPNPPAAAPVNPKAAPTTKQPPKED